MKFYDFIRRSEEQLIEHDDRQAALPRMLAKLSEFGNCMRCAKFKRTFQQPHRNVSPGNPENPLLF